MRLRLSFSYQHTGLEFNRELMSKIHRLRMAAAALTAGVVCSVVAAKCIRPIPANPPTHGLAVAKSAPAPVAHLLERACVDCHSNDTVWPWYAQAAPVSWMVISDVEKGRRFLNFSEWDGYSKGRKLGYLAAIASATKSRMPPQTYTMLHPDARLTGTERQELADWAKLEMRHVRTLR